MVETNVKIVITNGDVIVLATDIKKRAKKLVYVIGTLGGKMAHQPKLMYEPAVGAFESFPRFPNSMDN